MLLPERWLLHAVHACTSNRCMHAQLRYNLRFLRRGGSALAFESEVLPVETAELPPSPVDSATSPAALPAPKLPASALLVLFRPLTAKGMGILLAWKAANAGGAAHALREPAAKLIMAGTAAARRRCPAEGAALMRGRTCSVWCWVAELRRDLARRHARSCSPWQVVQARGCVALTNTHQRNVMRRRRHS